MSPGRSERLRLSGLLLFCGICWGLSVPLGKIATSTGLPPLALVFWELVLSAVLLAVITVVRRGRVQLGRRALEFYVLVAILGTLIPSFTFYASISQLPAGIMAILVSAVPLVALPIAVALRTDSFSALRILGLVLGLAGVALISLPGTSLPDPAMIAFIPVALIGPISYAVEGNFVAMRGGGLPDPVPAMLGICTAGAVMALPLMLLTGQGTMLSPVPDRAELALMGAALIHAVIYTCYIWLVGRAGAVFAGLVAYLVTASGVVWSMVLLGEWYSPWIWAAMLLMMGGMALVQPRGVKDVALSDGIEQISIE